MNVLNAIKTAYKLFNRLVFWIVIIISAPILVVGGIFIGKWYLEAPDFLFDIKNEMTKNKVFISKLDTLNGYGIWFDREKTKKEVIPFSVSIHGNDSSYVEIIGEYVHNYDGSVKYSKLDTVFKTNK
ncbi:hypothetical protein [Hymenobacter koreensis]|uniref:Cytochrome oxidase complex assembly protein 1 n=1 Tax=Hymenobacter koreensis TaxID=1084523 RepID=A0ABP8J6L0_9BACT